MIHNMRFVLYSILFLFAVATMALCAVRIHFTTHNAVPFYDPVVAELLVASILTIFWAPLVARVIHSRLEHPLFSSFRTELIGLFILLLFWLAGAAIATVTSDPPHLNVYWGDLSFCWSRWQCRVLTVMFAFAWLNWIVVFALFMTSLLFVTANKALHDPMHGGWDCRAARYSSSPTRSLRSSWA